jgi:exosome complex component RRP43
MLDVTKLCIKAGIAVWMLKADIVCLEFDGNVRDAALIALCAALLNTKLPVPTITDEGDITVAMGSESPLQLQSEHTPFPLSAAQVHDTLLVDPTEDEEKLAAFVLTVVANRAGKVGRLRNSRGVSRILYSALVLCPAQICSVYKPGGSSMTPSTLKSLVSLLPSRVASVAKSMKV